MKASSAAAAQIAATAQPGSSGSASSSSRAISAAKHHNGCRGTDFQHIQTVLGREVYDKMVAAGWSDLIKCVSVVVVVVSRFDSIDSTLLFYAGTESIGSNVIAGM